MPLEYIQYFVNYLLCGSVFGFFTMILNNYLHEKDENSSRFNFIENIVIIVVWPVYFVLFIYYITKKN